MSGLVAFLTFILQLVSVRSLIENLLTCLFCCNWVLLVIAVVPVVTAQYIFGIKKNGRKHLYFLKKDNFLFAFATFGLLNQFSQCKSHII